MKLGRLALVGGLLAAALWGSVAWAHGPGGPRGGVYVGPPVARGYYAHGPHYRPYAGYGFYGSIALPPVYAPYYSYGYGGYPYAGYPYGGYPPAVVTVPSSPPVYIEQAQPSVVPQAPAQAQNNWWYWCPDSQAYYPYVKECAGIWQRVPPQPPAPASAAPAPLPQGARP